MSNCSISLPFTYPFFTEFLWLLSQALKQHSHKPHIEYGLQLIIFIRARFQYSDCLDDQQMRLLELKFGHTDEIVCLDVQTYPVDNHPPYIALSYAWGDPNDTVNVLCDGKSIAVTRNLKEALWQFRENRKRLARLASSATSRGQLLHFWIDAICIDQECDREKSFQVGMMANIYQQARHVFTWLGPADKSSDIALCCIDTVGKVAEDCGFDRYASVKPTVCNTDRSLSRLSDKRLKDLFKKFSGWYSQDDLLPIAELKDFFTRPWWSRLWVLQEMALSRDTYFICGMQRLPKAHYSAFINMYSSLHAFIVTAFHRDPSSLNAYQCHILTSYFHRRAFILITGSPFLRERSFGLEALIRWTNEAIDFDYQHGFRGFEVTKPEDKIFAILGLAVDQEKLEIYGVVPNYKIPYQQTYAMTMAALLQQGHISLLTMCQAPRPPGLPSWVPDWSQPTGDIIQGSQDGPVDVSMTFRCSGNRTYRKSTIQVFNDHGTIRRISIKSYLYDEVYQIGCFTYRPDGQLPFPKQLVSWPIDWLFEVLRLSYCRRGDYKGFHSRLRAGARTCIADTGLNENGIRARVGNSRFSGAVLLLRRGIHMLGKKPLETGRMPLLD